MVLIANVKAVPCDPKHLKTHNNIHVYVYVYHQQTVLNQYGWISHTICVVYMKY